jgi:hypothetical protein
MRAALLINEKDLKEKAEAETSAVNGKSTHNRRYDPASVLGCFSCCSRSMAGRVVSPLVGWGIAGMV